MVIGEKVVAAASTAAASAAGDSQVGLAPPAPPPAAAAAAVTTGTGSVSSLLLLPCTICNRTFLPDVLARHQRICQKTALKRRNTFDSVKQRLQGIGIDQVEINHIRQNVLKQTPNSHHQHHHQQQHQQQQQSLSSGASRRVAGSTGRRTAHSTTDQYVHCPHCNRNFCFKAADRHIEWCRESRARRQPNNVPEELRERMVARNKYQPPLPRARKSRSPAPDYRPPSYCPSSASPPQPQPLSSSLHHQHHCPRSAGSQSAGHSLKSCPPPAPATAAATAAAAKRVGRDYAKEYRRRVSQEREARINKLRASPTHASPANSHPVDVPFGGETGALRQSLRRVNGLSSSPVVTTTTAGAAAAGGAGGGANTNGTAAVAQHRSSNSVRKCGPSVRQLSSSLSSKPNSRPSVASIDCADSADHAFISSSQLAELRRLTDAVTRSLNCRADDDRWSVASSSLPVTPTNDRDTAAGGAAGGMDSSASVANTSRHHHHHNHHQQQQQEGEREQQQDGEESDCRSLGSDGSQSGLNWSDNDQHSSGQCSAELEADECDDEGQEKRVGGDRDRDDDEEDERDRSGRVDSGISTRYEQSSSEPPADATLTSGGGGSTVISRTMTGALGVSRNISNNNNNSGGGSGGSVDNNNKSAMMTAWHSPSNNHHQPRHPHHGSGGGGGGVTTRNGTTARKARSADISVLQMMSAATPPVASCLHRQSQSQTAAAAGGATSGSSCAVRYCHQCGCAYPVATARFCCGCGTERVASVVARAAPTPTATH